MHPHINHAPITQTDRDNIVSLFDAAPFPSAISREVGINPTSVRKILIEAGRTLPSKSFVRKSEFPVNEAAFDELTDEARYWLGFLMADGNVCNENKITLSLQRRDLPHLERFRAFVGITRHALRPHRGSVVTSFASTRLADRLGELGIVPRKSLIAAAPDCLRDCKLFWLGVLDGDGCLAVSAERNWPLVILLGSQTLMQQYYRYISRLPVEFPPPRKARNIWLCASAAGERSSWFGTFGKVTTTVCRESARRLNSSYRIIPTYSMV